MHFEAVYFANETEQLIRMVPGKALDTQTEPISSRTETLWGGVGLASTLGYMSPFQWRRMENRGRERSMRSAKCEWNLSGTSSLAKVKHYFFLNNFIGV